MALRAAALRRRGEVERALALDEAAYGRCETCAGVIGAERLQARPAARTCVTCAAGRR